MYFQQESFKNFIKQDKIFEIQNKNNIFFFKGGIIFLYYYAFSTRALKISLNRIKFLRYEFEIYFLKINYVKVKFFSFVTMHFQYELQEFR